MNNEIEIGSEWVRPDTDQIVKVVYKNFKTVAIEDENLIIQGIAISRARGWLKPYIKQNPPVKLYAYEWGVEIKWLTVDDYCLPNYKRRPDLDREVGNGSV